jgi:hypothetical protein
MLTQKKFIKKYIQLHPNVTKKYALKKYNKARLEHFGTTNKKRKFVDMSNDSDNPESMSESEEEDIRKIIKRDVQNPEHFNNFIRQHNIILNEENINEIIEDYNDTDFDDIRPKKKSLDELLHEHNIDPAHFHKFALYLQLPAYGKDEENVQKYIDAMENGDFSPPESLSPEQKYQIRLHPKCKLFPWMKTIAPNDEIPDHVNILTDSECRYFYMYEGMNYVVTNKMIEIIKRHHTRYEWINNIYGKEIVIIDVKKAKNPQQELIRNDVKMKPFALHLDATYAIVGYNGHAYFFVSIPDEDVIIILNSHGDPDYDIVEQLSPNFSEDYNDYNFKFFPRYFNEQSTEGSCTLHAFTRLMYVVYNMKDKEHNLENLSYYFNKEKIPCQYAIFSQNLKYLAEKELAIQAEYESDEITLRKINFYDIVEDISEKAQTILNFKTKNPYVKAEILNFEDVYQKFREELNDEDLDPTNQKLMDFEKIITDTLTRIQSSKN